MVNFWCKYYQGEGERYVVLHLDWTVKVSRPIRWYGVVALGNTKLGREVNFPAITQIRTFLSVSLLVGKKYKFNLISPRKVV